MKSGLESEAWSLWKRYYAPCDPMVGWGTIQTTLTDASCDCRSLEEGQPSFTNDKVDLMNCGSLDHPCKGNIAPGQCQGKTRNVSVILRNQEENRFAERAALLLSCCGNPQPFHPVSESVLRHL